MTDFGSLLGGLMTFASLMAGISIAVERVVEMIKGAVPLLANTWPKNDQVRAGILQLIAAAVGTVVVSQMPDQIKHAMPAQLAVPLNWTTYAVLGLMACGGSGAWNHLLDILGAVKTQKETLASQMQVAGSIAGPVPALPATPLPAPAPPATPLPATPTPATPVVAASSGAAAGKTGT